MRDEVATKLEDLLQSRLAHGNNRGGSGMVETSFTHRTSYLQFW